MKKRQTHTKQAGKQSSNQPTNESMNNKQTNKQTRHESKQASNQTIKQLKTNNPVPSLYILLVLLPYFLLRFMPYMSWKEYMERARKILLYPRGFIGGGVT